jgi:hypothetical protein
VFNYAINSRKLDLRSCFGNFIYLFINISVYSQEYLKLKGIHLRRCSCRSLGSKGGMACQESKKAKKSSKTKERKKKGKWRRRGNPHLQYQSRESFTRDD